MQDFGNQSGFVNDLSCYSITLTMSFSHTAGYEGASAVAHRVTERRGFSSPSDTSGIPVISKKAAAGPEIEKLVARNLVDYVADCDNLKAMELRRRYKREANSHRNMLGRRKTEGAIVHRDFHKFRSFLRLVGPMPAQGATIERIINLDREYALGKVRWADRRTQNANKGDSLIFYDPKTGQTYTTSQLSLRTGTSPDTTRRRRSRLGWQDDEIIAGTRLLSFDPPRASSQLLSRVAAGRVEDAAGWAMTWKDREFHYTAELYRLSREESGDEAFLPTYEECQEMRAEFGMDYSEELYEGYIRRLWPAHRPHLNYFNPSLPESQRALIAKIDPEYVRQVTTARNARQALEEQI